MQSEMFQTEAEAREAIRKAQGQERTGYVLRYRADLFEARHWPLQHGSYESTAWTMDESK